LDVVRRLGPNLVKVVCLAAHRNADLLIEQALEFRPRAVCIGDESKLEYVRAALTSHEIAVSSGQSGFEELAAWPEADRVVVSLAGTPGLRPTLSAIEAGKDIALASKEVLVAAGHLVMSRARSAGVSVLPIDSEHSAIFQCLNGEDRRAIERIILTASGGAFVNLTREQMADVTAEQALAHPTWKMGRKVTVDSATLMNKGLEIIEAKWLFGVDAGQIEVVIHRQSIVHSMVRFADGSIIAQMGLPDMRLPIQYSLVFPRRLDTGLPRLDVAATSSLTFGPVDIEKYPCLALAMQAACAGGSLCAAMNAADEVAVEAFLQGRIGFMGISEVVQSVMERHHQNLEPSLEQVFEVDADSRATAWDLVARS